MLNMAIFWLIKIICLYFITLMNFLFNPFESINIFQCYFTVVKQIFCTNSCKYRLIVHCFMALLYLKSVHCFILICNSSDDFKHILLYYDTLYTIVPEASFNMTAFLASLNAVYFNQILFFQIDFQFLKILQKVLIYGDSSVFLEKTFRGKNDCTVIRGIFLFVFNMFVSVYFGLRK